MSYDEKLAQRVRALVHPRRKITEKKMFGGLAFLLGGKMFCGITKDELMVRVGPEQHAAALKRAHARPMDFTGRPMKGYVFVAQAGLKGAALARWVNMGADFAASLGK